MKTSWLHVYAAAADKNASPVPERLLPGWQYLQHRCPEKTVFSLYKENALEEHWTTFQPACITEPSPHCCSPSLTGGSDKTLQQWACLSQRKGKTSTGALRLWLCTASATALHDQNMGAILVENVEDKISSSIEHLIDCFSITYDPSSAVTFENCHHSNVSNVLH